MDCLDNLIGISNICDETVPSSGMYVQDLRGVTLKLADATIGSDMYSGVELIRQKITFAQNSMLSQLGNLLKEKFQKNSIIQNDAIGFYSRDQRAVALEAGKLKGIRAVVSQYPYTEFFISSITLLLNASITTNIYVYDLMTNKLLDTFPITTVADEPTEILVNKSYFSKKQRLSLFVCIDSSVAGTYESTLTPSSCVGCSDSWSNRYVQFTQSYILSASNKTDANIRGNRGTNGLSFNYSLNCSSEQWICNIANQLAYPLLHKVGAEIMAECINSKRLNSIVSIYKDDHKTLLEHFENEYISSMSALLQNMKLPNDICFQCNSRVKKVVSIP